MGGCREDRRGFAAVGRPDVESSAAAPRPDGSCDTSALARNVELGKKHKITGTPTLIFADGSRVPGAIGAADVEKLLASK